VHRFIVVALALASAHPSAFAQTAPEDCAVTLPEAGAFVPPDPYSPEAPSPGRFWYGTDGLWTMPAADGVWRGIASQEGIGDKVFWWSSEWDWRTDHKPALTVTARRLDANAPSMTISSATNAHAKGIHHAMLVGLTIPTAGCWEVTGEFKGHTLSYVVWLP
jgi:hypothetical protein